MARPVEDISGLRSGKLTAVRHAPERKKGKKTVWECICDCGQTCYVTASNLKLKNHTQSCGCSQYGGELTIGDRFGLLTVVKRSNRTWRQGRLWQLRCDCGNDAFRPAYVVKRGMSKDCGCQGKDTDVRNIRGTRYTDASPSFHGFSNTPTYRSWNGAKQRCTNPNHGRWSDYGGRGIKIASEWLIFENFLEDMGERPDWADGGIDRIDNDGNYEPGNCRWATKKQQQQNKRPKTTKAPAEAGA